MSQIYFKRKQCCRVCGKWTRMEGTEGRDHLRRGLQQFKQEMKSRYMWRGDKDIQETSTWETKNLSWNMISKVIKDVEERGKWLDLKSIFDVSCSNVSHVRKTRDHRQRDWIGAHCQDLGKRCWGLKLELWKGKLKEIKGEIIEQRCES